ncbi:hypothetical protein ESP62_013650 [Aeromicrobium fastidiosum]|uniref:Uncharacterized protein n=1 Tax=Aeromicrobium fastidiosum TaxID=52699 RepID=A0A641AKW9_9ACTN|nr:hypothetical protein ESP62_013650 [Aeromicrobium fastidiosum]
MPSELSSPDPPQPAASTPTTRAEAAAAAMRCVRFTSYLPPTPPVGALPRKYEPGHISTSTQFWERSQICCPRGQLVSTDHDDPRTV